ncbi:hypothetical protein AA313_de0206137 [Arthrobotrys entomopaga]|nr:hypothetical protein AA313_de0206137 [Arthrobotrys entomopaga]
MVLDFDLAHHAGFQSHFNSTKWSDITLVTGTARIRIRAHRIVLSEYSRWLATSCADPKVTEICIPRWESQIIYFVMRYMYTGELDDVGFETMMDIYQCAKDLEIEKLMDAVLYAVVLDLGKWEQVLSDKYKLGKLISQIFIWTTEKERRSDVYTAIFKLIVAKAYQDNLLRESWFVDLIKWNSEFGLELLKASFGDRQIIGTIDCYRRGCHGVIGEWSPCIKCQYNPYRGPITNGWEDVSTWEDTRPDDAWDKKSDREAPDAWDTCHNTYDSDEIDRCIQEKKTKSEQVSAQNEDWDCWTWDPLDTTWQDAEGWGPENDGFGSGSWTTPEGSDCYGLGF